MTWSIIARDPKNGLLGIVIASRFFAVGSMCPGTEGRVGAVCTQALMNPNYAARSLALMREGLRPGDIVKMVIAGDEGSSQRQLHIMDWQGTTSAYTGTSCVDWCGHLNEADLSVAGNMLAGPRVVEETFNTFKSLSDLPLVERLLSAMEAGEAAGGDKRGKQSAAVLIQGNDPFPRFSIRADDHADPLEELRRLYDVAKQRFIPFATCYPTRARPNGITDRSLLETIIDRDAGKSLSAIEEVYVD